MSRINTNRIPLIDVQNMLTYGDHFTTRHGTVDSTIREHTFLQIGNCQWAEQGRASTCIGCLGKIIYRHEDGSEGKNCFGITGAQKGNATLSLIREVIRQDEWLSDKDFLI